jgi:BolA protein
VKQSVPRELVEARLREKLAPLALEVIDESHLHVGHGAPGSHYRINIVSERFEGLSRVAAQRLVYEALGDWIGGAIHACAVSAKAPEPQP